MHIIHPFISKFLKHSALKNKSRQSLFKSRFSSKQEKNPFERLYEWIHSNGGQFLDSVGIFESGIFCARTVRAGTNLLSVPTHLGFTREALCGEFSRLNCPLAQHLPWPALSLRNRNAPFFSAPTFGDPFYPKQGEGIRERALVALCMMHEHSLQEASQWWPWLSLLPPPPSQSGETQSFIGGPTLSFKYLKELKGSEAFNIIVDMKIDFDWAWIWAKNLIKALPRELKSGAFRRIDFDHFMVLANQQSFVMPPLINFVQPALTAAMKNVEKIVFECLAPNGRVEMAGLHATRDIEAGEEILIEFDISSAETFARYGFAKPPSMDDRFFIVNPELRRIKAADKSFEYYYGDQVPSRRLIEFDEDLQKAYESHETWRWFAKRSVFDTEEMAPHGSRFAAEVNYEYPPAELLGMDRNEDFASKDETFPQPLTSTLLYELPPEKQTDFETQNSTPIETAFRFAEKMVRLRLDRLSHCDAAADEAELLQMFDALDAHFRREFAHLFEPERQLAAAAAEVDALERDKRQMAFVEAGGADPDGGNPVSAEQSNDNGRSPDRLSDRAASDNPEMAPAQPPHPVMLYTPRGEEVVDTLRRDALLLRYLEKTWLVWLREHLRARAPFLSGSLTAAPNPGLNAEGNGLGALESLPPVRRWVEQAHRWLSRAVAEALGLSSDELGRKVREMHRLSEDWRAAAQKKTYDERFYEHLGRAGEDLKLRYANPNEWERRRKAEIRSTKK